VECSDGSMLFVLVMIRYIENIDILFSIYCDILYIYIYFYISRYFWYIAIFYAKSLYFHHCITKI